MNKNKKKLAVLMLCVFGIVLVMISASYAIFRYTRTSNNINTIKMGNIEFSMLDGESVSITDKFPESDTDGNLNNPYTFTVNNTSSEGLTLCYNLIFLTNNNDDNVNYFNNEHIKYSLVKNSAYVAGTSGTLGNKLSSIDGFNEGVSIGEGIVLKNQAIDAQTTDTYELRIWISDDVNYSGNIDENGLSTGKYNEYQYSLKVRVFSTSENQAKDDPLISMSSTNYIINYSANSIANYFYSTVSGDVDTTDLMECGTGDKPGECSEIAILDTGTMKMASENSKSINKRTWYKTNEREITITLSDDGIVKAISNVNDNYTSLVDSSNYLSVGRYDDLYSYLKNTKNEEEYYDKVTLNDEIYNMHVYEYNGNQTWTTNKVFGDSFDVGTSDSYAKNMVIVKVNGDLTIESGVNVEPFYTEYGGPKGFTLYVSGTLTNNGTIDNSHGAYALGQNVYLYKNSDGSYEYVPEVGSKGGTGKLAKCCDNAISGEAGAEGVNRSTGGGGAGGSYGGDETPRGTSGSGGYGTSYSGGSGGGGSDNNSHGTYTYAGNGSPFGGAGGAGYGYRASSGWASRTAGGGAGNPGGYDAANSFANVTTSRGGNGTGGLLILYSNSLINNGLISANGSNGSTYGRSTGGSSGGGSINIFASKYESNGKIEANGGVTESGNAKGGAGGSGSISIGKITNDNYLSIVNSYLFVGSVQEFIAEMDGYYKIELWGAQGGDYDSSLFGGLGGYTSGDIFLKKGTQLYIYVGGQPSSSSSNTLGGWNGGGSTPSGKDKDGRAGGGATDIRLVETSSVTEWREFESLKSRIMVAGGGGGAAYESSSSWRSDGGASGGLLSYIPSSMGSNSIKHYGTIASQIAPGYAISSSSLNGYGSFGYGGSGISTDGGSGGGSGYYGGGGSNVVSGGAGGSSFISGHNGCDAVDKSSTSDSIVHTGQSIHFSGLYFTNTIMIDGLGYNWTSEKGEYVGMPTYYGSTTMTGNTGNGHAKITYLGKTL